MRSPPPLKGTRASLSSLTNKMKCAHETVITILFLFFLSLFSLLFLYTFDTAAWQSTCASDIAKHLPHHTISITTTTTTTVTTTLSSHCYFQFSHIFAHSKVHAH